VTDRPPSPQTRRRDDPDVGSTTISILVRDEQAGDGHPVDEPRWASLARSVLAEQHFDGDVELSVSFVGEPAMADLNRRFMGNEGPTDVLAFPIDSDESASGSITGGLPRLLGDVVICPAVAARNAPDHAGNYEDEVALLLVHGLLHVLGMDHAEDAQRDQMWQQERQLLTALHGELARDPWI
jgi:probable rRNA maturation factor